MYCFPKQSRGVIRCVKRSDEYRPWWGGARRPLPAPAVPASGRGRNVRRAARPRSAPYGARSKNTPASGGSITLMDWAWPWAGIGSLSTPPRLPRPAPP